MKFFGRKASAKDRVRKGTPSPDAGATPVSHRLTLEMKHAETFASMLAHSRASRVIEVADLLAGMYICNWDRLSQYWESADRDEIEVFLRGICRISPQRWHAWIELYDRERREGDRPAWLHLPGSKKDALSNEPLRPSAALASALKQAETIAPHFDRVEGRSIPILTSECVLLCILRASGSEVSGKLAATGLDAAKLEKVALSPRHPPLSEGNPRT